VRERVAAIRNGYCTSREREREREREKKREKDEARLLIYGAPHARERRASPWWRRPRRARTR
jgi:hypothetical protein